MAIATHEVAWLTNEIPPERCSLSVGAMDAPGENKMKRGPKCRVLWMGGVIAAAVVSAGCGSEAERRIDGTWLGTWTAEGESARVVFNLSREADDAYTGTLDLPDDGLIGYPLDTVTLEGSHVVLALAALQSSYMGTLSADGASMEGVVTIQGAPYPLRIEKQPGPLDYRRPQDPVAPLPYRSRDVTFANPEAAITLAGTLTWPEGPGPFKAVVLISGSGPQNRNEEMANHRPFLVLSDALTRAGVATLRYDDRGFAASTGDHAAATSLDFASDARAAVQFLRQQTDFPASAIGLVGHSEGGLIAPLAADGNADVGFLVLLAGPGMPGEQVLLSQARAISAAEGASTAVLDASENTSRRIYACFHETSEPDGLEACVRSVLATARLKDAQLEATVAELTSPWMRFFVTYDPLPVLRRTSIPVLALNGSLDLQVLADLNLPPIQKALEEAGNPRATVQKLEGLNHLFQHAGTGSPSEYATLSETLAPELLTLVATWIAAL